MTVQPASNRFGNLMLWLGILVACYFTYVYFPPFWDNRELKQAARVYASASRFGAEEANARENFKREAARILKAPFDEGNFDFTRIGDDEARVTVRYTREVVFPFTDNAKKINYKWSVTSRFQAF